jgi:hypothetical protein
MMTADELVVLIQQLSSNEKAFSLGVIQSGYTSGRPKVKFDGDTTFSSKQYPYVASYTPASNDRVILANVGGSHVILGKII